MSFQNLDVLKFYEQLPFNVYGNLTTAENQIKKHDPLKVYPELKKIFLKYKKIKVIDGGDSNFLKEDIIDRIKFETINEKLKLVEMIELKDHPWFVGVQFHPELKSRVVKAHPLFADFIKAAIVNK